MKRKKSKCDKYFLLTWKKIFLIVGVWVVSVFLHNLIYALFQSDLDLVGADEPFFFVVAVIIVPLYLLIVLIYSLVYWVKNRR